MKAFLQSLIFPRKMIRFRSLNLFLAMVLFIVALIISIGSNQFTMKGFVTKKFRNVEYATLSSENPWKDFPIYSVSKETHEMAVDNYPNGTGVYRATMEDTKVQQALNITIVFDVDLDSSDIEKSKLKYFDLEGYYKQERLENTNYVLYIFTKKALYYVYDLGQTNQDGEYIDLDYKGMSIFETTSAGYQFYLPASALELKTNEYGQYDTRLWTRKVAKDDVIHFEHSETIKPVTRHQEYLYNAIYSTTNRAYPYSELQSIEFDFSDIKAAPKTFIKNVTKSMIEIDTETDKLYCGLLAVGMFLLFPFFWAFITWLMSRKFVMRRFKEYYAIAGVCYLESAIISFILGLFMPFDKYALYLLIGQVWYFIFVTFRISTDPKQLDEQTGDDDKQDNGTTKPKLQYQNINHHKQNDNSSQLG